jgi:trk system potassium uptake protein TrkH
MPVDKRRIWLRKSLYLLLIVALLCSAAISLYEYGITSVQDQESILFIFERGLNLVLSIALASYLVFALREVVHFFPRFLYILCAVIFLITVSDYLLDYSISAFLHVPYTLLIKLTKISTFILLALEFSRNLIWLNRLNIGPGKVLALVFSILISTGTMLLLLPNATYFPISPVDALFTAVSAVCITGLSTLDVGAVFTPYGQFVIMLLFQLGGLGIMTLTSFFAYFFRGGNDYQNQIYLKDFVQSDQLSNLFNLIRRIITITLSIELISAVFIYFSLFGIQSTPDGTKIFNALFHAVSSFCNAGFTLYSDSIYTQELRFNFALHTVIAFTFIAGSLGFGVIDNLLRYFRTGFLKRYKAFFFEERNRRSSWLLGTNTRLVLWSSLILSIAGTLLIYILEYNHTLSAYNWYEKLSVAFFTATTPRSAGLTVTDTGLIGMPALFLIIFLMWIGGGPGSTAGGIKVTTFSLALISTLNLVRGKRKVVLFNREISKHSIHRCLAVLFLSLLGIGLTLFLLLIFDGNLGFLPLFFEAVSGFCTVGMSMGITADLSTAGKITLCFAMFIGRLGLLTLLISILKQIGIENYHYPKEEIFIN